MNDVTGYFFQQGILGVIIVGLIAVVLWQQRRIDQKDSSISELQEKRKTDTDSYTKSYTEVVREQIVTQKDSVNTLNLLQQSVNSMADALSTLVNGRK